MDTWGTNFSFAKRSGNAQRDINPPSECPKIDNFTGKSNFSSFDCIKEKTSEYQFENILKFQKNLFCKSSCTNSNPIRCFSIFARFRYILKTKLCDSEVVLTKYEWGKCCESSSLMGIKSSCVPLFPWTNMTNEENLCTSSISERCKLGENSCSTNSVICRH